MCPSTFLEQSLPIVLAFHPPFFNLHIKSTFFLWEQIDV